MLELALCAAVITSLVLSLVVAILASAIPYLFRQSAQLEQRCADASKRIDELDSNLVEIMKLGEAAQTQLPVEANGRIRRPVIQ